MKNIKLAKLVRNEATKPVDVHKIFTDVLGYLRKKVYPKLNDDDLYELNVMIREYFKKNT